MEGASGALLWAFGTPGYVEILVIGGVVLLLFGRRIPEVMRSLGRGVTQFKKGLRESDAEGEPKADADEKNALTGQQEEEDSKTDRKEAPDARTGQRSG